MREYELTGADGRPHRSTTPGTLGGHRRNKGYGRLGCRAALSWIAKGHYARHRVFFADEQTAIAAGYRPCAVCMPERYREWKADPGYSRPGYTRRGYTYPNPWRPEPTPTIATTRCRPRGAR